MNGAKLYYILEYENGEKGKKRKEGKKEKGKGLRYMILKNLHLVRWWVLKDGNTLNGLRRPIQICTRLLWPSDTLCILHDRLISSTYITKETIYVMTVPTMVQLHMVCGLCICLLLILATLCILQDIDIDISNAYDLHAITNAQETVPFPFKI